MMAIYINMGVLCLVLARLRAKTALILSTSSGVGDDARAGLMTDRILPGQRTYLRD